MRALPLFYCDHITLPLPEGHRFPITKYRLVRAMLEDDARFLLHEAPPASVEDLLRVHTAEYVHDFLNGLLERTAMRRIGFPWSEGLVKRTLASTGGTLAATKAALVTGRTGTVAGGTHHAFRDAGAGYCVFNDLAVAAEWARKCAGLTRIAVIDLDVHQGDGTARIFEGDDGVFTFSMHGTHNFPFRKQRSRLDIELADGASGSDYFPALRRGLTAVMNFGPELVLYQAGVDALASDRLGRLALQLEDLALRDQMVFAAVGARGVPLVITMGGGYSEPIGFTVAAHAQTFRLAALEQQG